MVSEGLRARSDGPSDGPSDGLSGRSRNAARMLAAAGAIALLIAEPLALMRVQTAAHHRIVLTVSAGGHHSYALVPIAVLALVLAWTPTRAPAQRAAAVALILLGLAALGIALLGDLPEIHRTGVVGRAASGLHSARTVAGAGLYVETLGAILLLAGGVGAWMPDLRLPGRRGRPTVQSGRRRSAS